MKGIENMLAAVFLFLFIIVIFGYAIIREKIPATTIEKTGCAGDNSKCDYPDTPGKLCKNIDDPATKDKIEYACVCVGDENCPQNTKCFKEGEYGSCK